MGEKTLQAILEQQTKEKDLIVEIARTQFIAHHDLNIRDIANKANIHLPVIYKYFHGKRGLIDAVVQVLIAQLSEKLYYKLAEFDDPLLKITQYGVNYINLAIGNYALFQFILNYQAVGFADTTVENLVEQPIAQPVENPAESYHSTHSLSKQGSVLYKNSIALLKELVTQLHTKNLTNQSYGIDSLTIHAWANVHGLAMIANYFSQVPTNNFTKGAATIKEAFTLIKIVNTEDGTISQETLFKAAEIIDTIHLEG